MWNVLISADSLGVRAENTLHRGAGGVGAGGSWCGGEKVGGAMYLKLWSRERYKALEVYNSEQYNARTLTNTTTRLIYYFNSQEIKRSKLGLL